MKVALITGASSGIGRETAKEFALNGYFVIAHYNKNSLGVDQLKSELETFGVSGTVFGVQADFTDVDSINLMFDNISKSFKHIDVLVNNAGIGLYKLITETTLNEWQTLFNVNITSMFALTNLVLPKMIERKSGKIINVSSIWGEKGASMEVAYSASKSAIIGYTKALAKELAPSGINVNCVCPGVIDTAMNARFSLQEMSDLINDIPVSRMGKPQDIAKLIYFLSTEKADYMTGQTITADGGFTL